MKYSLLPLTLAGCLTTLPATAEIVAYSKLNVTLNSVDSKSGSATTQDNWELNSNASRLGFKGSQEINDNLKAIFKMEYEVFVDDGDDGSSSNSEFKQRNIYAGLQGNWGTFIVGNFDTPLKLLGNRVDQFNDMPLGDIKNVMAGEERIKNSLQYTSPKWNGLRVSVDIMPGEGSGADGASGSDKDDDGLADFRSLAIEWEQDGFYIAAGRDQEVDSDNISRFVAAYSADLFDIGLLLQKAEGEAQLGTGNVQVLKNDPSGASDIKEQDAQLISGAVKLGQGYKVKAQWAKSEGESAIATLEDFDVTQTALGLEKKLGKSVKVFGYYSKIDSEQGDNIDNEDKTFAVGMESKF